MSLSRAARPWLATPAAPALLLLFGMIFGLAVFHLAGLAWTPVATYALYGGLLLWGGVLLVLRRPLLRQWRAMDVLFVTFVVLISASLLLLNKDAAFHAKFLPCLVLLPYGLGRMTGAADARAFLRALPWLGALLLLLCLIDYLWRPGSMPVYSRITFFGADHSPLLIAQLVAAALLALAVMLLQPATGVPRWRRAVMWALYAAMTMALVLIAARGVLVAVALAMLIMAAAMPAEWLRKLRLLAAFALAALAAYFLLPSPQAKFYERLVIENAGVVPDTVAAPPAGSPAAAVDPACSAFQSRFNSVTMRRVLYGEAIGLSLRHPVTGVGAGNFGNYSCAGARSYPHSTVLQAFAELGLVGGGILLALFALSLAGVMKACRSAAVGRTEAVFWLGLLALFGVTDQIYGSYLMAAGSCFMFGVCARLAARCRASSL